MEYLPLDEKHEIFSKMSGKELLMLCNSSKILRDDCSRTNFSHLWQVKIKQDFNVDYSEKDSYLEYLRLSYVYSKNFYIVTEYEQDDFNVEYTGTSLYDSLEKAFNYIYYSQLSERDFVGGYGHYKKLWTEKSLVPLKERNRIDINIWGWTYIIDLVYVNNDKTVDYHGLYEKSLDLLLKEINTPEIKEEFKLEIEELTFNLENKRGDKNLTDDYNIQEFCRSYNIENCEIISDWVYKNSIVFDEY